MIRTLEDLKAVEPPKWLWKGILTPGGITLLSAYPKVGKTTFIAYLLRAMWTQEEYMGLEIRATPTLMVSEEADTLIAKRCIDLGYSGMWPIGWLTPEPGRTWDDILNEVRHFATMYRNPLIIIDTLSRHWGIDDENDNAKVEKAMGPLIAIARTTGAAILLVHHTRKSGGSGGAASRGGSAIVGAVDIIIELDRYERGDKTNRRRIESYSRYEDTPGMDEALIIQLSEDGYVLKDDEPKNTSPERSTASDVRRWLLSESGWWQAEAIAAALGRPVRTIRDSLDVLVRVEESVVMKGNGRRGNPYQFSATEEVEDEGT